MERARSRAVLGALAAELGHDLQAPLNLFRLLADRVERGETLDTEDAELLREELERLGRMSARLRGLARFGGEKTTVTPRHLLELTRSLLGSEASGLALDTAGSNGVVLTCDAPLLGLALAELAHNAIDARQAEAGACFVQGNPTGFCVWNDGPGFSLDFQQALGWGVTSKSGAAGLGLTLAWRAARAHGFGLEARPQPGRTEVWLLIPPHELRTEIAKVGA